MANTFSSLFYYIVWSTKNRINFINKRLQTRLYNYIGGIIKQKNKI